MKSRPITRRHAARLLLVPAAGFCAPPALKCALSAQRQHITLLVAGAAGSVPDQYARRLAGGLPPLLDAPVVVENRPGANGVLSVQALLQAPPDGRTLLMAGLNVLCVVPAFGLNNGYDPLTDIAPVSLLASGYPSVLVGPDLPAQTLAELVALSHTRPGGLRLGSPGVATAQHLAARQLQARTGLALQHVPYASAAQVLNDLAGGHIDLAVEYASASVPMLQARRLRALAVLGPTRWPAMPLVGVAAEQGVQGVEAGAWLGVVARAGSPAPALERLERAVHRVAEEPAFAEWVQSLGSELRLESAGAFSALIRADLQRWSALVAQAGLRLN